MQTFIDKAEIGATVTLLSKAWGRGYDHPLGLFRNATELPGSEFVCFSRFNLARLARFQNQFFSTGEAVSHIAQQRRGAAGCGEHRQAAGAA
jgi:hypothetical protein